MRFQVFLAGFILFIATLLSISTTSAFSCDSPVGEVPLPAGWCIPRASTTAVPTPTASPTANAVAFLPSDCPAGGLDVLNSWQTLDAVPVPCYIKPTPIATATPVPVVRAQPPAKTPTPAPKTTPVGDSPVSARPVDGTAQVIQPGALVWYKNDNGDNTWLEIWVDTYQPDGLSMAVYSPEQTNELSPALTPKGRASPVKNDPTHALYWSGFPARGIWYFLVVNNSSNPIQYSVGTHVYTTDRTCRSYWESVQGKQTYWTDCGHYGTNK